jgi:hypothetical protein
VLFAVSCGFKVGTAGPYERKNTLPKALKPIDIIADIECRRVRLRIKKKELAERAGIIPEMYSYLLRRGRNNMELPKDCLMKVLTALRSSKEARA